MTTSMKICIAFETSNTDAKKNSFKFKWIQTMGTETYYEIQEDKQNPHDHHELFALPKVKNILKSMKTRGSFPTCVISLTPELKEIYFDAEEDVMFRDEYLQMTYSPSYVRTEFGGELAESRNTTELSGKTKENKKDFKKIKDIFVLNNFDGKNVSVTLWLKKFESECMHCGVEEDMDKILILRLFLDGIAKEWFDSKLIILGLETDFQIWKNNCLDSFCETSWYKHREAYSFRYNRTDHSKAGYSPEYLLYGKTYPIAPEELIEKSNLPRDKEIAFKNSLRYHEYNKKLVDKNRKDYDFKIGDYVYVENKSKLNRKKFEEIRIGPFLIVKKISDTIYEIDIGNRKKDNNYFHVTKLLPYDNANI